MGWLEGSWGGCVGGRVGGGGVVGWRVHGVGGCVVVRWVVGGFMGLVHILTHHEQLQC